MLPVLFCCLFRNLFRFPLSDIIKTSLSIVYPEIPRFLVVFGTFFSLENCRDLEVDNPFFKTKPRPGRLQPYRLWSECPGHHEGHNQWGLAFHEIEKGSIWSGPSKWQTTLWFFKFGSNQFILCLICVIFVDLIKSWTQSMDTLYIYYSNIHIYIYIYMNCIYIYICRCIYVSVCKWGMPQFIVTLHGNKMMIIHGISGGFP